MSHPDTPRAALFDLDGVLADVANVHVAAWERTCHRIGFDIPEAELDRAATADDRAFLTRLLEARGVAEPDLDGWVTHKRALTRAILADSPRTFIGAGPLLAALRERGVLLAVASCGRQDDARTVLAAAGWLPFFAAVLGREDAPAERPDPALHLAALDRLGVPPAAAVAMEATPIGLTAARLAGLRSVAVGHRGAPGPWCAGTPFVPHLRDTALVLDALLGPR
jgi:HAD superfamily hydrolase (TIGR01509 family)